MKFRILTVGRMKAGPERALYEHYAARVRPAIAITEVEERRPLTSAELKSRPTLPFQNTARTSSHSQAAAIAKRPSIAARSMLVNGRTALTAM